MVEIAGCVDVASELRIAPDYHTVANGKRECKVAVKRPRAIAELELHASRQREHIRAVTVSVGHQRDGVRSDEGRECVRAG